MVRLAGRPEPASAACARACCILVVASGALACRRPSPPAPAQILRDASPGLVDASPDLLAQLGLGDPPPPATGLDAYDRGAEGRLEARIRSDAAAFRAGRDRLLSGRAVYIPVATESGVACIEHAVEELRQWPGAELVRRTRPLARDIPGDPALRVSYSLQVSDDGVILVSEPVTTLRSGRRLASSAHAWFAVTRTADDHLELQEFEDSGHRSPTEWWFFSVTACRKRGAASNASPFFGLVDPVAGSLAQAIQKMGQRHPRR